MTEAERIWKAKLAAHGCVACMRIHGLHTPGPVQLHHFRGRGWGRGDYTTLIPLCYPHHKGRIGVHGMGTKAFDEYYAQHHELTQRTLLDDAQRIAGWTDEQIAADSTGRTHLPRKRRRKLVEADV